MTKEETAAAVLAIPSDVSFIAAEPTDKEMGFASLGITQRLMGLPLTPVEALQAICREWQDFKDLDAKARANYLALTADLERDVPPNEALIELAREYKTKLAATEGRE